jgi:hypothetical protein
LIKEATRWNTLVSSCDPFNCSCPSGTETIYCFPFYNPVADSPGVFTHAFTQTAACVPFTNCAPSVLCISPNGEVFANGHTWPFPGSSAVLLDEEYGSGWYAEFQQVMVDLLYQVPHFTTEQGASCSSGAFAWEMDDGGCQADSGTIHYFPYAPLVEARLTVPAGALALPTGIAIGWTTPAGIVTPCPPVTDANSPDGNESGEILIPPGANGYGLSGPQLIWSIWGLECGCIDGSGRFADTYRNQVIGCT